MPELPEVETTRRGIAPHIMGKTIAQVNVRNPRMRIPIPPQMAGNLTGQTVTEVDRRGKYLILRCREGSLIMHLGMSGCLRLINQEVLPQKHDHVDIIFNDGVCLRLRDPRRFGLVVWAPGDPLQHPLLKGHGPEPLSRSFDGAYLFKRAQKRKSVIKTFIMDSRIVAGVGNIYASEALFLAGIHPLRVTGRITCARYDRLAAAIKEVLREAIKQGGTTLRDFVNSEGRPGYFSSKLSVYGRAGEACHVCGRTITQCIVGQRSSYFCGRCQC